MSIERRLIEYGKSLLEPGQVSYFPRSTPMHRIKEDKENAGAGGSEFHYDMVEVEGETTPCMPDGGVGDMVGRMAGAIAHDRRCVEIRFALERMPADLWVIVKETYIGYNARDIPRRATEAAALLHMTIEAYRHRKRKMLAWLERDLCIVRDEAA